MTTWTREELKAHRQRLLDKVGMTYAELSELAKAYALRHDERSVYEAIESIDWILGGEPWPEPSPQPGGPSQPYPLPPPLRGSR